VVLRAGRIAHYPQYPVFDYMLPAYILKRCGVAALLLLLGAAPAPAGPTPVPAPDDHALGDIGAPVVIIEYASLTCPHCAHFHAATLARVREKWIEPGKAQLIFRDFPLDKAALVAAMMARCGEPSAFFPLIGDLFARQEEWTKADDIPAALTRIGVAHGLREDAIRGCWTDDRLANEVVQSRLTAEEEYDVDSTPTLFINGARLDGDNGWESFDRALEEAAAKTR
jgi:protein-disulfide isomerase